jgi:PAS domain S-box-containing protein
MFSKSNNINKIKKLVNILSIKDIETRESKELLEAVLDIATDGYWDFNVKDRTGYISNNLKVMLGYSETDIDDSMDAILKLINSEDLNNVISEVEKHFNSNGAYPFFITSKYKHRDGHYIEMLCRGKVIEWDVDNNPIRIVGTHIDINNLKYG